MFNLRDWMPNIVAKQLNSTFGAVEWKGSRISRARKKSVRNTIYPKDLVTNLGSSDSREQTVL